MNRRTLMTTDKHRPAPFLVCSYSFGEDQLPTVRPAWDLGHAADLAKQDASASCMPLVRVYSIEEMLTYASNQTVCRLVTSMRL